MAVCLYQQGWYGVGTGSLSSESRHQGNTLCIPKTQINKIINLSNVKCYNSTSTDYVFDETKAATRYFSNTFNSVEVGTGYKITLYSEENGKGDKITAVTNDPDFGNKLFSNRAKSIKIENYVLGDVVMNCYSMGVERRFSINDSHGKIIKNRNGTIWNTYFSLEIPSGYSVRLYEINHSTGQFTGNFADFTKDYNSDQKNPEFKFIVGGIAISRLPMTYNETPLQIPQDVRTPLSNDIEVSQRTIFSDPNFYKPWFHLADAFGYNYTYGTRFGSTPGDDVSISTTNFNNDTKTSDYIYKANYRASESNATNASDRLEVTIKDVQHYIKDVIWGRQQDYGINTSEVNNSRVSLCNCPIQNLPPGDNGDVNFGYDKKYTETKTVTNTFSWGLNQKVGVKLGLKTTVNWFFVGETEVSFEASAEFGANQQWTDAITVLGSQDYTFKLSRNVPLGWKAIFYVVQWKATNSRIPYTANIAFDYKVKFDKARLDYQNAKVDTPNNLPIFSYTFGDSNYGAQDRLRRDYTLDNPQFYTEWNWSNLMKDHYYSSEKRSSPNEYIESTQRTYIVPMEGSVTLQGALNMDGKAEIVPMTAKDFADCNNRSSTAKSKSLNNNNIREALYIDENGNKSFIPVGTTRTINGAELSSSISSNLNNIEVPLGNTGNEVKITPTLINSRLKQFIVYNNSENTSVNSKIKIEVYDLSGKLVVNIFSKIGTENDVSNLSTGVYIVKVLDFLDNKELKTEKIILQ